MLRHLSILTVFCLLFVRTNGQTCTWTLTPQDIFYPNTNSVETSTTSSLIYLCGPNTVVYDTNASCRNAYLNAGCTLYHKSTCLGSTYFYLKNGSSLIILPGANNVFMITLEPTATYTNMSASSVSTYSCSSVSIPTINCTTGINEQNKAQNLFKIWPNPSSSKINVVLKNTNYTTANVIITNELGKTVYEYKQFSFSSNEIPVDNLNDGIYFIFIKTKEGQQSEKFILVR